MKEITVDATLENIDEVQGFVEQILEDAGVSMKVMMTTSIAVEEIYINIASYAYSPEVGKVTICCFVNKAAAQPCVVIRFVDSGVPYNPLEKQDTDTTLSVEEREIGGLGILMVKKSMDEITYEYKEEKNILTMEKIL